MASLTPVTVCSEKFSFICFPPRIHPKVVFSKQPVVMVYEGNSRLLQANHESDPSDSKFFAMPELNAAAVGRRDENPALLSLQTILTEEELKGFKPQHAMLKKGEASFHHPLMVHGSFGNRWELRENQGAVCNSFCG